MDNFRGRGWFERIGQIKNNFLNKIIKDIKAKHKKLDGLANIDKYRVTN